MTEPTEGAERAAATAVPDGRGLLAVLVVVCLPLTVFVVFDLADDLVGRLVLGALSAVVMVGAGWVARQLLRPFLRTSRDGSELPDGPGRRHELLLVAGAIVAGTVLARLVPDDWFGAVFMAATFGMAIGAVSLGMWPERRSLVRPRTA
ncbi:hypothetical protein [Aquihabitans sp. McL0605]|uniref:hypothetical protein n=1 Tax=Aquihabitans sp. McL0605 TaxID=3415671 RepID=UPI003CEB8AF3